MKHASTKTCVLVGFLDASGNIDGGGGGAWHLMLQDGKLVGADIGRDQKCTAVYRLDADTFATLATGQESASSALDKGQLVIDGNGLSRSELVDIFDEIVRGSGVGK